MIVTITRAVRGGDLILITATVSLTPGEVITVTFDISASELAALATKALRMRHAATLARALVERQQPAPPDPPQSYDILGPVTLA